MDPAYSEEDKAFRAEIRAFVEAHLPADLARRGRHDFHPHREDQAAWTRILAERGWSMPHWPAAHGGPGWSAIQRFIFEDETRRAYAPTADRIGAELVAPVIYTFGSEEQRQAHLPGIRLGETFWAQGFSEPGAGSDLSSLRTRAVRDGDHYVVNGQKTWTTEGHHADMMFMLVRSNPDVKPQAGISSLVVDLKTPGITRRPIWTLDEGLTVNEFFFDDVRVPVGNLIGEEGQGWTHAKFLLGNERTNSAEVPHTRRDIAQLREIARIERKNGRPLIEDPLFRAKLARIEIDTKSLEIAVLRALTSDNHGSASVASLVKVRGSELRQRVADLAAEALGDYGIVVSTDGDAEYRLYDQDHCASPTPEHGIGVAAKAMFRRATTIYGGANEIQRTLIAKTVLEL